MGLTGFSATDYLFRAAAVWPGAEPFLVNAWQFRPQGTGQGDGWALSNSAVQDEFRIRLNNGNSICQEEDGGVVSSTGTGIQAPDSIWFSQQADFNTNIQVWLNAANNTSAGGGSATGFNETRVGRSLYGSIFQAGWAIAEVSIWDTSGFSEANLDSLAALLHNGGAGGNGANPLDVNAQAAQPWTGALVAYWRLGNTSDICDLSGNGHDLSIVGSLSNFATHPPVDATTASCGVELLAETGAVAIVGQDAAFQRDLILVADPGSIDIAGSPADLLASGVLAADPGAVDILGSPADFIVQSPGQFEILAESGSIAIVGALADFVVILSQPKLFCRNCGKQYDGKDEKVNFFFVSSDEVVPVEDPVLETIVEVNGSHDSVIIPISGEIPFGVTIFLDFSTAPNPASVSVSDSRGNVYKEQVREGASNLFRGFLNLPLLIGDQIRISYNNNISQTALVVYFVKGITDADAADSDHVLNEDIAGPIVVPNGGIAIASAYAFSAAAADAFIQDPAFTDIGTARVDINTLTRTVFSSFRKQGGTYGYTPTLTSVKRLTLASYSPVGSIKFKRGSYTSPRRIADIGAQILACPVDPMFELDRAMDRGDPYPHRSTKR